MADKRAAECSRGTLSQVDLLMLYAVSANRALEFHARLTDGSTASQRPDGAEIVAAMKRSRAAPDGTVRWTETCYCPTPLQHERPPYLTAISPELRRGSSTSLRPSTACR